MTLYSLLLKIFIIVHNGFVSVSIGNGIILLLVKDRQGNVSHNDVCLMESLLVHCLQNYLNIGFRANMIIYAVQLSTVWF